MPAMVHLTTPLPEAERNVRIYAGDILVFHGFSEMRDLIAALRAHCVAHLGHKPEHAHEREPASTVNQATKALRQLVRKDAAVAQLFNTALAAVGVDRQATYGDGVVVRIQTPGNDAQHLAPLAPHRDTWGSNISAQTNWWAPIYSTTPNRTLAMFPNYYDRVVANDSASWDFKELVRRFKSSHGAPDYPLLPTAKDLPPWAEARPINLVPGDLLCFSGAHLHASVPNTTRRTRLSFESRTVNGMDALAARGAPNTDGCARWATYQVFKHLVTQQKLGELKQVGPVKSGS